MCTRLRTSSCKHKHTKVHMARKVRWLTIKVFVLLCVCVLFFFISRSYNRIKQTVSIRKDSQKNCQLNCLLLNNERNSILQIVVLIFVLFIHSVLLSSIISFLFVDFNVIRNTRHLSTVCSCVLVVCIFVGKLSISYIIIIVYCGWFENEQWGRAHAARAVLRYTPINYRFESQYRLSFYCHLEKTKENDWFEYCTANGWWDCNTM